MKKLALPFLLVFSMFGLQSCGLMDTGSTGVTSSSQYGDHVAPTRSAVEDVIRSIGYRYEVDQDNDIVFEIGRENYTAYIIFNESNGRIWNLQVIAQFGTEARKYDQLLDYANRWNYERKYPKVAMVDEDSLRLTTNYPVEFGFSAEEFRVNVLEIFEQSIEIIAEETDAWRR